MKVYEKVYSTEIPNSVSVDLYHIYIHSDVEEATSEEKLNNGFNEDDVVYGYTVTEYDKDEYILKNLICEDISEDFLVAPRESDIDFGWDCEAYKQGNMISVCLTGKVTEELDLNGKALFRFNPKYFIHGGYPMFSMQSLVLGRESPYIYLPNPMYAGLGQNRVVTFQSEYTTVPDEVFLISMLFMCE